MTKIKLLILLIIFGISGCTDFPKKSLDEVHSQTAVLNALETVRRSKVPVMQLRALSERTYFIADSELIRGAIISTLQDLGYFVTSASDAGYISAQRKSLTTDNMMVTYRNESEELVTVRVNFSLALIDERPENQYQKFFSSLDKSIFLRSNGL